jgi:hypothetical protein
MLCSLLKVNWHFSRTCHLHLQGQRIGQARNQSEAHSKSDFQWTTKYCIPEDWTLHEEINCGLQKCFSKCTCKHIVSFHTAHFTSAVGLCPHGIQGLWPYWSDQIVSTAAVQCCSSKLVLQHHHQQQTPYFCRTATHCKHQMCSKKLLILFSLKIMCRILYDSYWKSFSGLQSDHTSFT